MSKQTKINKEELPKKRNLDYIYLEGCIVEDSTIDICLTDLPPDIRLKVLKTLKKSQLLSILQEVCIAFRYIGDQLDLQRVDEVVNDEV